MRHYYIIGFILLIAISSCKRHRNYEDDSNSLRTSPEIENPNQPIPHITEEERIDSLLRINIAHDTAKMLELPRQNKIYPEVILFRVAYTVSFNPDTRNANWVAWSLKREHTDGPFTRRKVNSSYYEDIDSILNHQILDDWRNASPPYDHGHMCPAGDNKWDEAANRQTFFLSNICPQHEMLNQGDWENLESKCRSWANDFGEIFIVAGPIFESSPYRTLPESSIAIPDKFFKVVLCLSPKPMAIGFVYPNDDSKHRFFEVAKSIDYIEKITGIDFFYMLDDEIENQIESSYNLKDWKIREK